MQDQMTDVLDPCERHNLYEEINERKKKMGGTAGSPHSPPPLN